MSTTETTNKHLSEGIKELRKMQINKFLKNPLIGFFEMSRLTEEECDYYFNTISVGDTLVYTDHSVRQVYFYEVKRIDSSNPTELKVSFGYKKIIDKDFFVEKPQENTAPFTITRHFLTQFVCILKKDQRKFQVHKESWGGWGSGYNLTVNSHYEATPTGKIKHFGSKDLAMNFVKALASGSAKHTNLSEVVKYQAISHQVQPFNLTLSEEYKHEVDQAVQPLVDRLRAIGNQNEFVPSVQFDVCTLRNMFPTTVDTP